MSWISLKLPFPPSVNHYWRSISRGKLAGRTLISEAGRKYRRAVADAVKEQAPGQRLYGSICVALLAQPPDRRRRDLDNMLKAVFDSLQHAGVFEDDGNIDEILINRGNITPKGCMRVNLRESSRYGEAT